MKRIATLLIPAVLLVAAACSQSPTAAKPASAPASARHDGTAPPPDTTATGRGILFGGGF